MICRCGPWCGFEAVEYATLEWVDWFNFRRPLEPIGNIPPAEAGKQHYAAADIISIAARLTSNGTRQTGAVREDCSIKRGAASAKASQAIRARNRERTSVIVTRSRLNLSRRSVLPARSQHTGIAMSMRSQLYCPAHVQHGNSGPVTLGGIRYGQRRKGNGGFMDRLMDAPTGP